MTEGTILEGVAVLEGGAVLEGSAVIDVSVWQPTPTSLGLVGTESCTDPLATTAAASPALEG